MSARSRSRWLRSFVGSYKRSVAIALAFGAVSSGFAALLMFASGFLISQTAQVGVTLFSILIPVAFVQVFGFGKPLARYLERLVSHDWVLRVTSDLRRRLYRHVARNANDPSASHASGEYLSLLADDIAHLQNLYLRVVFPSIVSLLVALGATMAFGTFSPPFALAMLIVLIGTGIGIPLASVAATKSRSAFVKRLRANAIEALTDDVLGSKDWVLSGRSNDILEIHFAKDREIRRIDSGIRMVTRAFELASSLLLAGAICAVIAWSGGSFGGDPTVSNWIAAFTLGFFPIVESIVLLPSTLPDATTHLESVDRLREIFDFNEERIDSSKIVLGGGPISIELEGVDFAYPNSDRPSLAGVNLRIEPGQRIAVLGKSGSGKSTMLSLMRGMIDPQSGSVSIGGHAVEPRTDDLSGVVGVLPQDPYLFDKSLRANLTMGRPEATDSELRGAIAAVGLAERISKLPKGLETPVGETGVGFSGGEAHRLALARVLVANTNAIIVDEPFSALDPETEDSLMSTLLEASANRTLVVVTHRLANIESFDRVIFLEGGRITLDGTPEQLKAESAYFRSLVEFDCDSEREK